MLEYVCERMCEKVCVLVRVEVLHAVGTENTRRHTHTQLVTSGVTRDIHMQLELFVRQGSAPGTVGRAPGSNTLYYVDPSTT